jgi:hypothetical protein
VVRACISQTVRGACISQTVMGECRRQFSVSDNRSTQGGSSAGVLRLYVKLILVPGIRLHIVRRCGSEAPPQFCSPCQTEVLIGCAVPSCLLAYFKGTCAVI